MSDEQTVTEFSATFGVYPGYEGGIPNGHKYNFFRIDDIAAYWQSISKEVFDETGVLISCIVNCSRAAYPKEFGCPQYGEITFTVQGNRNPKYCDNDVLYRETVLKVIEKIKVELKQSTVTLVFRKVEILYLT